ncbi:MAG: hypothetical protein E7641_07345 [Ruminococcaceae bacterium]|nr:hypothetical protein [Oscillospiraceae bacterium]
MFLKLLKYDIRSVWRIWWIAAVSLPALSVVGALAMRIFTESIDDPDGAVIIPIFALLLGIGCIFAIALSFVLTMVLVYLRFYKNLYSDEGYLTFTLPVSRREIFFAKTVNAFIWYAIHFVLLICCGLIFFLIVPPSENGKLLNTVVFELLGNLVRSIFESNGLWMIPIFLVAIFILIVYALYSISFYHLCITIGAVIAKKMKLLAAVGVYYAVSSALSLFLQIVFIFAVPVYINGMELYVNTESVFDTGGITFFLLLIVAMFFSALALTMYGLTQKLIDRKLNLA